MVNTNPHQPSRSVSHVKQICYPEAHRFSTNATEYGCEHEKTAREKYKTQSLEKHSDFAISTCGFFVDPARQYIGASPDGLVCCACCGEGVLEVKCLHSASDADSLHEVVAKQGKKFCLQETEAGP